jgi:hypothetical protein
MDDDTVILDFLLQSSAEKMSRMVYGLLLYLPLLLI